MTTVVNAAMPVQAVIGMILLGLVLMACYYDGSQRRIPNVLTLGGALCGVVLQVIEGGVNGLLIALAGWAVGFAFLIPGYALGRTGAGDVKLLAAVGTFVGPHSAMVAALATILCGALMAVTVAALARGDRPWQRYALMCRYLWTTGHWSYVPPDQGEVMAETYPYAYAIAVGAVAGFWHYLLYSAHAAGPG